MTKFKNEDFIGLQHENCYLMEGKLTFGGERGMSKFWLVGGTLPFPSRENPATGTAFELKLILF